MPQQVTKTARNARIMRLRGEGESFNSIAFRLYEEGFGRVSPQRVSEIFKRAEKKAEAAKE